MVKRTVVQTNSIEGQGMVEWPTCEEDASGTRHEFFTRLNLNEAYKTDLQDFVVLITCVNYMNSNGIQR